MKKSYITPVLKEVVLSAEDLLTIITVSSGDTSGYTEDNPFKAESKGASSFEDDEFEEEEF